jgi:hypothetical protein
MNLIDSIKFNLAILPLSREADEETQATHRALRRELGMNPDIFVPGDKEQ